MIKKVMYIFYVLIVVLVLSEMLVRSAINWIPDDLIGGLSQSAMIQVYNERGQVQEEDSPIYHYKPFQKMNWHPHINIDENGYRNSIYNQTEVDTILLGDSLIFAKKSEVDLGDLFRAKGKSALNLAIGGYAPQHYRDVYKKYVIDKNIQHKNVIVSIFVGNDFNDSTHYPWELSPTAKGNQYYPWIVNLIIEAVSLYGTVKNYNIGITESKHRISLPYKEIGIRYLWWTPVPSSKEWNNVDSALGDILEMADQVNAKVSFVIIPSPSSVYGLQLYPDFSVYVDKHNKIVNEFRKRFKNINVIDINNELSTEIKKRFLYTDESDAHFNTYGTKIFFKIISKKIIDYSLTVNQ